MLRIRKQPFAYFTLSRWPVPFSLSIPLEFITLMEFWFICLYVQSNLPWCYYPEQLFPIYPPHDCSTPLQKALMENILKHDSQQNETSYSSLSFSFFYCTKWSSCQNEAVVTQIKVAFTPKNIAGHFPCLFPVRKNEDTKSVFPVPW